MTGGVDQPVKPRTFKNVERLLEHVFELDYFHPNDKGKTPIEHHWVHGGGNFVVCLGENASGKSFFRRLVCAIAREAKVEAMPISMEGRNMDFGGMRGFIYGDESWQSTGVNSTNTVLTGINTCRNREKPHVVFWDEPDLGLSDGWAAGMGVALREFAKKLPDLTYGAFVVTHNRALVRELVDANPHFVYFGSDPPETLIEWVDAKVKPLPIEKLGEVGHKRFKMIQAILDDLKNSKDDP